MTGVVRQINISNGGLPKWPVAGPVMVRGIGIEGDRHRNMQVHGGPNQALLMIAAEAVDELAAKGYPVTYGSLGENLTVTGMDPSLWRAGQRFRVGEDVEMELTKLRAPCLNLDPYGPAIKDEIWDDKCKTRDITSPRWARGGFYARVIKEGPIAAGAPVVLEYDVA